MQTSMQNVMDEKVVNVLLGVIVNWPLDLAKLVVHEFLDVSTDALIRWLQTKKTESYDDISQVMPDAVLRELSAADLSPVDVIWESEIHQTLITRYKGKYDRTTVVRLPLIFRGINAWSELSNGLIETFPRLRTLVLTQMFSTNASFGNIDLSGNVVLTKDLYCETVHLRSDVKINFNNFKIVCREHIVVDSADLPVDVDMNRIVGYDIFAEMADFTRAMRLQCLVLKDMSTPELFRAPQEKWTTVLHAQPANSFYVVILDHNSAFTPQDNLQLADSGLQKELHIIHRHQNQ